MRMSGKDKAIPLNITEINAKLLLERAVIPFEEQMAEKEIRLIKKIENENLKIHADAGKVLWILVSYLGNALRYTHRWGSVTVGLSEADGQVVFSVSDTGNGIEAQKLEKIFQTDPIFSGNTEFSATGIALPIAREIAEAHGGKVSVSSLLERGSTFRVHLPVVK